MLFIEVLLISLFVTLYGLFLSGVQRKIVARIQRRIGPPVYQQYIDVIKLFSKRENISHNWVFDIGPIFAVVGLYATLVFIPMAGFGLLSFDGDLIVVMYLMVISGLGMALGAGASGNPNAGVGVMRALGLMMAYELPFVLSVLAVMVYYDTTSLATIVSKQQSGNIVLLILPLSAIVADIALQGQFGKKPFDQTIAPHEVATGPMVEYGGKYLGMLFLWHSVALVMEAALFIDLFLGGGLFFTGGFLADVMNFMVWAALVFFIILIALFIGAVMPRWRIDQAFVFYWTWPTLISIIGLAYALGVSA